MGFIKNIKDFILIESKIKDIEKQMEPLVHLYYSKAEENVIYLEKRIPQAPRHKEVLEASLFGAKKIIDFKTAYLNLKVKFKDNPEIRLEIAKDWQKYFSTLLELDVISNDIDDNDTRDEKLMKNNDFILKTKSDVLKSIQDKFNRLL